MRSCEIFLCRGCMIVLTSVTTVKKKVKKVYFRSTFGKAIWNIWQLMFCDSRNVLLRCYMIFVCGEVVWFFSLTQVAQFFLEVFLLRCCDDFFVERFPDLLYGEVSWFFVWRGCVTFCVNRFFLIKKKFSGENRFLVAKSFLRETFFCWKKFF